MSKVNELPRQRSAKILKLFSPYTQTSDTRCTRAAQSSVHIIQETHRSPLGICELARRTEHHARHVRRPSATRIAFVRFPPAVATHHARVQELIGTFQDLLNVAPASCKSYPPLTLMPSTEALKRMKFA